MSDYADTAIRAGGDASINGAFAWFHYEGVTWLVESHHNASAANAKFIDGVDLLVLIDRTTIDMGPVLKAGVFDGGAHIIIPG